jgi:hypothetical protein
MLPKKVTAAWLEQRCEKRPDGCWVWSRARHKQGYGKVAFKRAGKTRHTGAHRAAYEVFVGAIPAGLYVLHRCDNPPCINPAHLFAGTALDNMLDAKAKGRLKEPPRRLNRGEDNGRAKLTPAGVREVLALKGRMSQRKIAAQCGISKSAVRLIHQGKRWKHLGTGGRPLVGSGQV